MRKDIFVTPIYETKVDLDKIDIPESDFSPTWESGVLTTYADQACPSEETFQYLSGFVREYLDSLGGRWSRLHFLDVWRNKYDPKMYQGYHIHPESQLSYIIYESVESKTVFLNPSMTLIQNQIGRTGVPSMPLYYEPELSAGNMIIFPSYIGHQVRPGNTGVTISGNIGVTFSNEIPYDI